MRQRANGGTEQSVRAPVAASTIVRNGGPRIVGGNGKLCIKHREYFTDVTSAVTALDLTQVQINPGLPVGVYGTAPQQDFSPFTWANPVANNFERYRIKRMSFEYEPACATTQVGTLALYIDYDPTDPIETTKPAVLNMAQCVHGPLWTRFVVPYNHPQATKWLLTRKASLVTGGSYVDFDGGTLNIIVMDAAASPLYGRLYIDYEIELDIPQT